MLDASTCGENRKYTCVCAENKLFVFVLEKMIMKIVLENRLENNCNPAHAYNCTLETVNASQESRNTWEAPTEKKENIVVHVLKMQEALICPNICLIRIPNSFPN